MPWPIAISIGAQIDTWPPLSLINRHAASSMPRQWMYSSPGRSNPARPSSMSGVLRSLPTRCCTTGTPTSRASANTLALRLAVKRERQQLILGAEIGLLQPLDVLRILRGGAGAAVSKHRPRGCRTPAARECRRRCALACG